MNPGGGHGPIAESNILIDARMGSNPGGIARYVNSLLTEYVRGGYEFETVELRNGARYPHGAVKTNEIGIPALSLREQFILPIYFRGMDLLHVPNFNVPLAYRGKLVVTIHDLTLLKFPELLPNGLVRRWVRLLMFRAVSSADKIIAVSEHTKRDLLNEFDIRGDKVVVIYNGLSERFSGSLPEQGVRDLRDKYHLPESYILSLGNLKRHKNLFRMIKAIAKAAPRLGEFGLVITGKGEVKSKLRKEISAAGLDDKVILTGYVDDSELPLLYKGAKLFVYPSLYEGFGFPPLESMASGTPVVASNTSSIPEITGDAALLVSPESVDSIADGIVKLWSDLDLRKDYTRKGLQRAEDFSWEQCAKETLSVYQEVLVDDS